MADVKRCHNCGRKGTRQFDPYPDHSFEFGSLHDPRGAVTVNVGAWGWECSNKNACRRRWPKPRGDDDE